MLSTTELDWLDLLRMAAGVLNVKILDLDTWEEFGQEVAKLRTGSFKKLGEALMRTDVLFRGQSDSNWQLGTTLERTAGTGAQWSLFNYFDAIHKAYPPIAAHTGRTWDLPNWIDYHEWAHKRRDFRFYGKWLAYEFMAYLRHHGFPSPLLDWSLSPFVAAFFAFRAQHGEADRVAIYAYQKDAGQGQAPEPPKKLILPLSSHVQTHARHFRQQCRYTVCVEYDPKCIDYSIGESEPGGFVYANHEQAFARPRVNGQDGLWKITLPRSIRPQVLATLNDYNLNAYSLFGSEDALVETLAANSQF